jgi:branched-chain amino acid transport system permease protein
VSPFCGNTEYHLPGVNVTADQLIVVGAALGVAVVLRLFFTRTRMGATMRAVVDDPGLVSLAGVSPRAVSQLSWAMGASLAALAGILLAPLVGLTILTLTLLVIDGYSAAVVGRLRSLPLTVAGGILLGLAESYSVGYFNGDLANRIRPALPMILLFLAVILLRGERLRTHRPISGWTPRLVNRAHALRATAVFLAIAVLLTFTLPASAMPHLQAALALGFILLSLVLLAGYGGQVSLCQMTFVGLGAYVMGKVAPGGSPLGALFAVAVCGALGVVVAIPVLRLRGLYLALGTLAFAAGMDTLFFNHAFGIDSSVMVPRLDLGFSVAGDHAYAVLLAVCFAAAAYALLAMRRSSWGRRLAAFNDSPAACATLGLRVETTKLLVFGASAAMAGFGGVLLGGQEGIVSTTDFQMLNSLVILLLVTLGGATTVSGALVGAVTYSLYPVIQAHVPSLGDASYLLTGVAAISVGRNPQGIVGALASRWDRTRPPAEVATDLRSTSQVLGAAGAVG